MYGLSEKEIYIYRAVQNGDSATGVLRTDFIKPELLNLFKELSTLRVINSERENRIKELQTSLRELESKAEELENVVQSLERELASKNVLEDFDDLNDWEDAE